MLSIALHTTISYSGLSESFARPVDWQPNFYEKGLMGYSKELTDARMHWPKAKPLIINQQYCTTMIKTKKYLSRLSGR